MDPSRAQEQSAPGRDLAFVGATEAAPWHPQDTESQQKNKVPLSLTQVSLSPSFLPSFPRGCCCSSGTSATSPAPHQLPVITHLHSHPAAPPVCVAPSCPPLLCCPSHPKPGTLLSWLILSACQLRHPAQNHWQRGCRCAGGTKS